MNFYEQHIGDYAKDAGHLSMIEDGAYRRLIDAYYAREQALPADIRSCCKLARATTKVERDAVAYVLSEFFTLADDGHHQKRCDSEIARYLEAEPEREHKKENAKERQRRSRERRKALFDALRSHGITPSYDTPTHELESRLSRVTVTEVVTPVTRDDTVTHFPLPTSQQDQKQQGGSAAAEPPLNDPEEIIPNRADPIPYQAIVDAYNQRMTQLAKVRLVNGQRRTAIRRAWQSLPPEHRKPGAFKAIFAECAMDDFLNGSGPYTGEHANWRPDFDHLIKIKTLTKVYEKAMARRERMRQQPESQPQSGASA